MATPGSAVCHNAPVVTEAPTAGTIPPYNKAVVLGPEKPQQVARDLQKLVGVAGVDVAGVDINDIGGNILGSTLDRAGEQRLVEEDQGVVAPLDRAHHGARVSRSRDAHRQKTSVGW